MAKYCKRIVDDITRLIKADTFTIAEICAKVGISPSTFHKWIDDYPDFAKKVEDAKNEMKEVMVLEAKKSLRRKLVGYDVTETKVETIPSNKVDDKGNPMPKIKKQITTTRHVAADTAAIIFTLTNGDPANWKNRQNNEVTGKDGKDLFGMMTDDELDAIIAELQRKLS